MPAGPNYTSRVAVWGMKSKVHILNAFNYIQRPIKFTSSFQTPLASWLSELIGKISSVNSTLTFGSLLGNTRPSFQVQVFKCPVENKSLVIPNTDPKIGYYCLY